MSGFDRALGALSRQEMLECARGLLKFLTGEAGRVSGAGGEAGLDGVRRAGRRGDSAEAESGASVPGARDVAAAGRGGRRGGGVPESERVRRGADGPESAEWRRGYGEAAEGADRRGEPALSSAARERGAVREDAQDSGAGAAAFQGPERRYENAVGARGMEMSRVSDYFRRDSRRYDAGFTRF